jgi:hypothetical protein
MLASKPVEDARMTSLEATRTIGSTHSLGAAPTALRARTEAIARPERKAPTAYEMAKWFGPWTVMIARRKQGEPGGR